MKTSILTISLLTLAVATACDRRDAADNQPTPEATAAADPATPADPSAPAAGDATADPAAAAPAADDSLALGLLAAVNEHEIQAAQQAVSKQVSAPVLEYARMMEKEHGDNLAKTKTLGTLAATAEVQAMQEKGKNDLAELGKKSGKEYEAAYVDAMVKGHTEALALIDGRLLSLASPGPVRDHLSTTRDHVAMHLEAARKLQSQAQPK
jgi:putative membrane protein